MPLETMQKLANEKMLHLCQSFLAVSDDVYMKSQILPLKCGQLYKIHMKSNP